MKTYRGVKIPKNNGRPQLWTRGISNHTSLRIVYPSGKVEYCSLVIPYQPLCDYMFTRGCTSRNSLSSAIKAFIDWDTAYGRFKQSSPLFLGYL